MPTLIIHAPDSEVQQNNKRSFNQTISTGKATGYAINRGLFAQLSPDGSIVVICKRQEKQVEGKIQELKATVKTGNGIQRYDIIMVNLTPVPYTHGNMRLNRNGVTVI